MTIQKAALHDLEAVCRITQHTIRTVYPHYYPPGAVDYFSRHHHTEAVAADIANGAVYLCISDTGEAVGTVTLRGNEICRLFVLPEHQGKGFGRALLDFAEAKIAERRDTVIIDASLPAKAIYLKRGYIGTAYHTIETGNGDYLCYDFMEKAFHAD